MRCGPCGVSGAAPRHISARTGGAQVSGTGSATAGRPRAVRPSVPGAPGRRSGGGCPYAGSCPSAPAGGRRGHPCVGSRLMGVRRGRGGRRLPGRDGPGRDTAHPGRREEGGRSTRPANSAPHSGIPPAGRGACPCSPTRHRRTGRAGRRAEPCERWIADGANVEKNLKAAGCRTELAHGEDAPATRAAGRAASAARYAPTSSAASGRVTWSRCAGGTGRTRPTMAPGPVRRGPAPVPARWPMSPLRDVRGRTPRPAKSAGGPCVRRPTCGRPVARTVSPGAAGRPTRPVRPNCGSGTVRCVLGAEERRGASRPPLRCGPALP